MKPKDHVGVYAMSECFSIPVRVEATGHSRNILTADIQCSLHVLCAGYKIDERLEVNFTNNLKTSCLLVNSNQIMK